jgi:hypothetical protein
MSITSFNLAIDGRSIVGNDDGTIDVNESRIAVLDTAETNPQVILEDPMVPKRFQVHPLWNFVRLESIDAKGHDKGRKMWTFGLRYNSGTANELENDDSSFSPERYINEHQQRVEWGEGTERVTVKYARRFMDGRDREPGDQVPNYGTYDDNEGMLYPVSNSVGEPFNPPIMRNEKYTVARITRNHKLVPPEILTYRETVNDDPFILGGLTIPTGCAYLRSIKISSIKHDRNTFFYTVNWDIALKPLKEYTFLRECVGPLCVDRVTMMVSPWDEDAIDQGVQKMVVDEETNTIRYEVLRDREQNAVKKPIPLNGRGVPLDWTRIIPELSGTPPTLPTLQQKADGVVRFRFMVLEPKPFSVFNFH